MLVTLDELKSRWDAKRWPNFSPAEFACPCCGECWWDSAEYDRAQGLRDALKRPVSFNSTHRCARHNARVGGAPLSQHKRIAFDFPTAGLEVTPQGLRVAATSAGFSSFGIYNTFVHMDSRRPRRFWANGGSREMQEAFR